MSDAVRVIAVRSAMFFRPSFLQRRHCIMMSMVMRVSVPILVL